MSHVKLVDIVFTYQMTQKKLHFVPAIHPIMQDAMIEQFVPFKKDMDICASWRLVSRVMVVDAWPSTALMPFYLAVLSQWEFVHVIHQTMLDARAFTSVTSCHWLKSATWLLFSSGLNRLRKRCGVSLRPLFQQPVCLQWRPQWLSLLWKWGMHFWRRWWICLQDIWTETGIRWALHGRFRVRD